MILSGPVDPVRTVLVWPPDYFALLTLCPAISPMACRFQEVPAVLTGLSRAEDRQATDYQC